MLSGSEGNCIEYFHKSCVKEGQARVGLELWLAKKQPSLVFQGGWWWWWGVWSCLWFGRCSYFVCGQTRF